MAQTKTSFSFHPLPRALVWGGIVSTIRPPTNSTTCTNSTTLFLSPRNLSLRLLYSQPATSDPSTHHISSLPGESLGSASLPLQYMLLHIPMTGPINHRRTRQPAAPLAGRPVGLPSENEQGDKSGLVLINNVLSPPSCYLSPPFLRKQQNK